MPAPRALDAHGHVVYDVSSGCGLWLPAGNIWSVVLCVGLGAGVSVGLVFFYSSLPMRHNRNDRKMERNGQKNSIRPATESRDKSVEIVILLRISQGEVNRFLFDI